MSCFTTGGPGKEHRTNKPPPTSRVWERSKGGTACLSTSQNPSLWHPSLLNKACTTRKDFESEWLAKDNPKTNPITIKPETGSHVAEQFSLVPLVPLPYCSPPGWAFPIKSLALSAHVSPQTINFWVLDKAWFRALEGVRLAETLLLFFCLYSFSLFHWKVFSLIHILFSQKKTEISQGRCLFLKRLKKKSS